MYKNIILAIDFDKTGHHAAQEAKALAELHNASLHVIHVVEPLPAYAANAFMANYNFEEEMTKEAKTSFDKVSKELGLTAENLKIGHGHIKTEVLAYAKEHKADLIVVGSHSKHGLSLLFSSQSNGIVHDATCNVLVVKTTD
jgi:universal stress protein A